MGNAPAQAQIACNAASENDAVEIAIGHERLGFSIPGDRAGGLEPKVEIGLPAARHDEAVAGNCFFVRRPVFRIGQMDGKPVAPGGCYRTDSHAPAQPVAIGLAEFDEPGLRIDPGVAGADYRFAAGRPEQRHAVTHIGYRMDVGAAAGPYVVAGRQTPCGAGFVHASQPVARKDWHAANHSCGQNDGVGPYRQAFGLGEGTGSENADRLDR